MTPLKPIIPAYKFSQVFEWHIWGKNPARRAFFDALDSGKRCPFCNVEMQSVPELSGKADKTDYVVLCGICGFWFGKGHKNDGDGNATTYRGAVGLISHHPLDSPDVPTDELVRF